MKTLIERPNIEDAKIASAYKQLGELLNELEKRTLPPEIVALIDGEIDHVNVASDTDKRFAKTVKLAEAKIVKVVEKEMKIVPKNYYKKFWALLGFTLFGLPIGVAIALSLGNIGLLGVGLPIGMALGLAVGSSMDKKAAEEGRQLDFEVKG